MGNPTPISMGRGSSKARDGQGGIARFLNAYVEELGEAGKTAFIAYCINGCEGFAELTQGGAVRKMLPVDAVLLVVSGRLLFAVNSGGVPTLVGGIPSDGFVTMVHNRKTPNKQVAIVCDGLWFIYEGGTLTQGSDTDLPPPIAVVEIDGYFVFIIADGRWFIAGPNNSDIDPLDFAEAEASADSNVMAAVRGRTLIIFGQRSTEFWDPNGDPTFPFARTSALDMGCFAGGSVANVLVTKGGQAQDTVIFASTDKSGAYAGVVALAGYQPTVISTPEVDRLIRDEPSKASIQGMGWMEDGHGFYIISGTSFTKCWDGKTGEWHDRASHGSERWYASCVAQFAGMTLFGHNTDNTVLNSLPTLDDEDGNRIIWSIQPPPIHMWPRAFKVNALYADMITGVGINSTTDDDANPEMVIDYSRDGGDSWGAARRVPLGADAQRQKRVSERGFGRFDHNGVTFRFTCSAKVRRGIQQMALEASPLRVG